MKNDNQIIETSIYFKIKAGGEGFWEYLELLKGDAQHSKYSFPRVTGIYKCLILCSDSLDCTQFRYHI